MTKTPLLLAVLVCQVLGAAPRVTGLPANSWVKVNDKGGGVRRGSAVVWLQREGRFLVLGSVRGSAKLAIARPFSIQTFDPADRTWQELRPPGAPLDETKAPTDELLIGGSKGEGPLRLNPRCGLGGRSAYDSAKRHVYVHRPGSRKRPKEFTIARYDVDGRRWEVISRSAPPAEADGCLPGQYGSTVVFMEGVASVFDPVNREILLLGGRTGNADRGFVGHWAFSPARKKWRRLEGASTPLSGLRAACMAARRAARDTTAAARNVFYSHLRAAERAAAVKGEPAKLLHRAAALTQDAAKAVALAKADGWQAEAVARARRSVAIASGELQAAGKQLDAAKLDAAGIKRLFDASWKLDEAADFLRSGPGPRTHAGAAFDPLNQCVVLFGGDHGDYLLSDTWVYRCGQRKWQRVFPDVSPKPRRVTGGLVWLGTSKRLALVGGESYVPKFIYFRRRGRRLRDVWTFDTAAGKWSLISPGDPKAPQPTLTCQLAAGRDDVILGLSSAGRYESQWDGTTWLMRLAGEANRARAAKHGVPAGRRTYLSVVREYDPCWYDAAAAGTPKAVAEWLAKLKPNTWTAVPLAPRPAPRRDWGTAAFDPHRDQFYHWTGGHMADPASIVSTYHVAAGRWSIPYVAEYFGKGIGFNGRPDCMNHTYLNYAYDTVSRKLVCTSLGGTCLYDPDRREFDPRIDQPFRQHPYYTKTVSTPRGVVCWERGYFGLLNAAARAWVKLPVTGKLPRIVHGDENAITYDAKRDVLWLMAADGYRKPNGQVWRYDMKSGAVKSMSPAAMKAIGVKVRPRESVYLPKQDIVLHNAFADDRQIAYDPAGNRWVTLGISRTHKDLGGVSIGLMYDARRDLVWAMAAGQRMYVLRVANTAPR